MYEALDAFLNVETWDSLQWVDEGLFFIALDKIVRNPGFNAEKMGDYIAQKYFKKYGVKADAEQLDKIQTHYERAAQNVQRYLRAIGGI